MLTGEELGRAIAIAIKKKGITQKELADAFNVRAPSVNGWLKTGRISKPNLMALMDYFADVVGPEHWGLKPAKPRSPEAKITGTLDPWDDTTPLHDDDVELPLLKTVCLAAGAGLEPGSEDFDGMKLRFSKNTLRKVGVQPECAVCVMVMGNSMEPMLPDGATVGVNTADKAIKDGDIYAINHNGELRVKQLYRLKQEGLRLRSINRDEWEDEDLGAEEAASVIVIGRVFWWSALR